MQQEGVVYETHDNGGRPFRVEDFGGRVVIYRELDDSCYSEIYQQSYSAIFPGRFPMNWETDSSRHYNWLPGMIGNSVLLHISDSRYMYIGESIWSFDTHGDTIFDYYSPIGRNDVPYPFAVGEQNTYLMVEKVFYPNIALNISVDPYPQHYGDQRPTGCRSLSTCIIQERLY